MLQKKDTSNFQKEYKFNKIIFDAQGAINFRNNKNLAGKQFKGLSFTNLIIFKTMGASVVVWSNHKNCSKPRSIEVVKKDATNLDYKVITKRFINS